MQPWSSNVVTLVSFCLALYTGQCQEFRLLTTGSQGVIYILDGAGNIVDTAEATDSDTNLATGLATDIHAQDVTSEELNIVYAERSVNGSGAIYRKVWGEDATEIFDLSEYGAFVERVVIDQTSGNIYFTAVVPNGNGDRSFISVMSPRGELLPLVTELDTPLDIVLHPERGIMFWSDHGSNPHISSANMDGTNDGKIIVTDIQSPNGLAIDFSADALYWTDGELHKIEKCDFSGGSRETVLELPGVQLMDIVTDGDFLYYNNWNDGRIVKASIDNPDEETTFAYLSGVLKMNQMSVYSTDLLQEPTNAACSDRQGLGDCSSLCLPTSDGYSCGCEYEFGLKENGKTCVNAQLCPEQIYNGNLSESCTRHRLELCQFTCKAGYENLLSEISCNGTEWDEASPCVDTDECAVNNGGCATECHNFLGGYTCCEWPYTVDLSDSSKCRASLLPYGDGVGDYRLKKRLDGCGPRIRSPIDIPIYGQMHNNMIACTNGFVTFYKKYLRWWPPGNIEEIFDRTLLAPYFADVDIRGSTGEVFYQAYDVYSGLGRSEAVQLAEHYVGGVMRNKEFKAKFVLVVTWFDVPNYPYYLNPLCWNWWWWWWNCPLSGQIPAATFQLVLATDGTNSYLMYIYKQNQMNWVQWSSLWTPPILVGFTVKGGQHYKVHPLSFTSLALQMDQYAETNGIKGLLMYHLKQPGIGYAIENYGAMCLDWYHLVEEEQTNPFMFIECPCSIQLLRWDPWFSSRLRTVTSDTECYDSWSWWINYPNTMRCCYDRLNGGWISDGSRAGGFLYYHPWSHPTFHQLYDINTRKYCCELSDNCDKYRQLRPIGTCYSRSRWRRANFRGDPHITTLDEKKYTFNGLGEYMLLKVETENVTFSLQGRTERAITAIGTVTNATIFSAFAAKDNTDASVQVELSANKSGMDVYGNGIDLTDVFQNESLPFSFDESNLQLTRQNGSLNVFFMGTGIQLDIFLRNELLIQEVTVPEEYMGLTKGLLGNFDGNPDNDFVFQNGDVLTQNASERYIFQFGQSWITTSDQSIFDYQNGKTHSDFSFPDFVPQFLDEADEEVVQNATNHCGEENLECIFDLVFTGREDVADDTKLTDIQHSETVLINANDAPVLNGTKKLEMTYGEEVAVLIQGFDESDIAFTLSNSSAAELRNETVNSTIVLLYASAAITEQISVYATDNMGKTSAPFVFDIILCSGCSNHGVCNFTAFREGTKTTDAIKYVVCVCDGGEESYWTGADCEEDYDGCLYEPCAIGQDCVDYNATYHEQHGQPFECSDCPAGFELNDTKCQDINECEVNTDSCEQLCVNTDGSFECLCEPGFRQRPDNFSACDDINECEESSHNCEHQCLNTVGSFNCSCYTGFTLNADGFTCGLETDVCADFTIDCSATAGCLNDSGKAKCFCKSGYELRDNGTNCKDVDECQRNVCPQNCQNTEGSFTCSCLVGYELLADETTCSACNKTHWGEGCQNICQCGQGAVGCDPVRGCVCGEGWSGSACGDDIDECLASHACGDINKICTNSYGSFDCTCREGFKQGSEGLCEDINECDDMGLNTCQHFCSNVIGSFTCGCYPGYVTDSNDPARCQDLDECQTGIAGCEQICTNVPGRYNCYCYYGFILNDDRRTCRKVDDLCSEYGDLNCSHICVVENENVKCECQRGYRLAPDQQTCIDIDECFNPSLNLCTDPTTCYNYDGGYECSCQLGYSGKFKNVCVAIFCDGFHYGVNCEAPCDCLVGADYCDNVAGCICLSGWTGSQCGEDKNECDAEVSLCSGANVICVNTAGSYNCVCKEGFSVINGTCSDVDECNSVLSNNCEQICQNTVGSFICRCTTGFIMSNESCQDINECLLPNECEQLCSNTVGGYRCQCDQGYRLDTSDGRSCIAERECAEQNITECNSNNADCVFRDGHPDCVCRKGYESVNGYCTDIRECNLNPCDHFCHEEEGGYNCSCRSGFKLGPDKVTCEGCDSGRWGEECNETCSCNSANTANCSSETGQCSCLPGWSGSTCEEDVNECFTGNASCPENSECINLNGTYFCKCHTGFIKTGGGDCIECDYGKWGVDCSELCQCSLSNTKSCNVTDGTCLCLDGWAGDTCADDIDECNSGTDACNVTLETCTNTIGSFVCNCKDGYRRNADKVCQECDVELFGIVCSVNCNCVAENTQALTQDCDPVSGFCLCKPEWTGIRCEQDVDECETGAHNCGGRICRNTHGGFKCDCEDGFVPGTDGSCVEDEIDNNSLIIGLAVGLPLGVVTLIAVAVFAANCVKGGTKKSHSLTEDYMEQKRELYRMCQDNDHLMPEGAVGFGSPFPLHGEK